MNRIEDKKMAADAAKYFKEEVLGSIPGIPRETVCAMVDSYIYYQQSDVSRSETRRVVEETCLKS